MLEDALYHLFLVNWELFTIAGFMALLLLTGIIIGVQLQFLHVRFRTVPDWEPSWCHGDMMRSRCGVLLYKALVLSTLGAGTVRSRSTTWLRSRVSFLGQWTVSFSLVLGLFVGRSLMAMRVNRILKSNMMWVVSRVGHCCSCLPCRQNMKFDLCAINDNKKVTDFAAAPTT